MYKFQDGEKASILRNGVEVMVTIFLQSGELIYVFDEANRYYQFAASDVYPAKKHQTVSHENRPSQ